MNIILTENQLSKIISEDPEGRSLPKGFDKPFITYTDPDAISFGFYNNHCFLGFNPIYGENYIEDYLNYYNLSKTYRFFQYHDYIAQFNKFLFNQYHIEPFELNEDLERDDFDFPGRLWINSKVISFYTTPPKNKIIHLTNLLQEQLSLVYNIIVNMNDFFIDSYDHDLISVKDYSYNPNIQHIDDFERKIHLLPADIKKQTPQMQQYLDYDEKFKKEKYKKIPEYLWNYYKSMNLGESKNFD